MEITNFKDSFELLSIITDYLLTFPKVFKYTLGQKLQDAALDCFHCQFMENRDIKMKDIKKSISVINSYLGFMKHYKSFNIKRSLIKYISYKWWDYCHVSDNFCKICINN